MTGLVGVLPPVGDSAGAVHLDALPEPPASQFSGFAVRCEDRQQVKRTLEWYRSMRDARPALAFGLVCDPEACAEQLAGLPHSLTFLLRPSALVAGGLPGRALDQLREAGVEGRILGETVERYGEQVLEQEETLRALIARACCGGTVSRAARDLGVSPQTVTRRLGALGVSAVRLRSWTRHRSYRLRLELGVGSTAALEASGWTSQDDRRKAVKRLSHRSTESVKVGHAVIPGATGLAID